MQELDQKVFRQALGKYASGITIVGGMVEDKLAGFTCQSFYSVSVNPPLVSFSVMRTSKSWPAIRPSGHFTINVLSWDQMHLSDTFARSSEDRWAGVKWKPSPNGAPVIDDALLWLDCSVHAEHEAGDHWVVICNVHHISDTAHPPECSPLIYYQGRYRQLAVL